MYEKVSSDTGLTDGSHVTVRFDSVYKQLSRREVKAACRVVYRDVMTGSCRVGPGAAKM